MPLLAPIVGVFLEKLAVMALNYIKWIAERKDIAAAERARIYLDDNKQTIRALEWKAAHPVKPPEDPHHDFPVDRKR